MLLAAHSLAGAAVGEYVFSPFLALLLGFILHFLLDAIPHYDTTDGGKITARQIILTAIDASIGIIILIWLYPHSPIQRLPFIAGAVGGVLPDILYQAVPLRNLIQKSAPGRALFSLHERIQKYSLPPVPGIAIQLLVWLGSIYLILKIQV